MKLIPVKYHNKNYPESVAPLLDEIAGHFDSKILNVRSSYSLHTEYSYMERKLDSELLFKLDEIKNAAKDGIPQLWKNEAWGEQFACFLGRLTQNSVAPEVIEIHPPFRDYCLSINKFWKSYMAFYEQIKARFPGVSIVLENRCGTKYRDSSFLFSTCEDMLELCSFLCDGHQELRVVLDYPQLFSAERINMNEVKLEKILSFNRKLAGLTDAVGGIHLWGKRKSEKGRWTPHTGDFNTFFSGDMDKKRLFLESLKDTYCDGKARYFVPEVNSSERDLQNIVYDLLSAGIEFQQEDNAGETKEENPHSVSPSGFRQYLIAVDWTNDFPEFVLGDITGNHINRVRATGSLSIRVGKKKYCVGNKDVQSGEYLGCPIHAVVDSKTKLCRQCLSGDRLKACVRCTGQSCNAYAPETLERCQQEHFVYLAYFPDGLVKVGVAHGLRKYVRLREQGALYAYYIASCESGKQARKYESQIRMRGVRDKVTGAYKMEHLGAICTDTAENALSQTVNILHADKLLRQFDGVNIIEPPERFIQKETLAFLAELAEEETSQFCLWEMNMTDNRLPPSVEELEYLDKFSGEIIAFVGTIAILKRNEAYYRYDFKRLYGLEFEVSNPTA